MGGDKSSTWWMGATDLHLEGTWLWMSGAPWSYENWNEGEPNQNGNEDCGAFDSQADGYKVTSYSMILFYVLKYCKIKPSYLIPSFLPCVT